MKNKLEKGFWLSNLLCLLPLLAGVVLYQRLPDLVAVHWGLDGAADRFAAKGVAVFALPLILLATNVVVQLCLSFADKNDGAGQGLWQISRWLVPVVSLAVQSMLLANALAGPVQVTTYVRLLIGAIVLITGNYLPKTRQNFVVGIRLPWTLRSQENWRKTHRLTGYLWVFSGAAIMLTSFFTGYGLLLAVVVLMVAVPVVYSFGLHCRGIE